MARHSLILLVSLLLIAGPEPLSAQVPAIISVQLYLEESGVPVTGTRDLEVSWYTSAVGGVSQHTEVLTTDVVDGIATVYVGSLRYMAELGVDVSPLEEQVIALQDHGQTAVVVAQRATPDAPLQLLGAIAIADQLRPNAAAVIAQLRTQGIEKIVMLTGDNDRVAQAIGRAAGVDEVHANLLPQDKLDLLKKLQAEVGPVAMVGDGVNDAPALATATIGIAMGAAGTDVALETADVVLMADDLAHVPYMIGLSRRTKRVLIQNLLFALVVILVLIGSVLGFGLPLPLSVVGHEGSTVLVSLNGLRMLGYRG